MNDLQKNKEVAGELNSLLGENTYYQVILEGGAYTFEIGYQDYYEGMYWRNFGSFESVSKVNKFIEKIISIINSKYKRPVGFNKLMDLLAENGVMAYE